MSHIYAVVCQSQPLDNLLGYTITRIAATTMADSETKKEALIRDFPKVTEIPEAQIVKTATEVGVRAIQDHKVIRWNTCWKCRLSEGTDDM